MFRFYVYIEADKFVLALMIYADTKSQARKIAVKKFNKAFKNKRIYKIYIRKDHWWFGGYIY